MPVLKAKGEAEALCAQLNREGVVDACITADSDAFLFGAQCIIKRLQINSKVHFSWFLIFFQKLSFIAIGQFDVIVALS